MDDGHGLQVGQHGDPGAADPAGDAVGVELHPAGVGVAADDGVDLALAEDAQDAPLERGFRAQVEVIGGDRGVGKHGVRVEHGNGLETRLHLQPVVVGPAPDAAHVQPQPVLIEVAAQHGVAFARVDFLQDAAREVRQGAQVEGSRGHRGRDLGDGGRAAVGDRHAGVVFGLDVSRAHPGAQVAECQLQPGAGAVAADHRQHLVHGDEFDHVAVQAGIVAHVQKARRDARARRVGRRRGEERVQVEDQVGRAFQVQIVHDDPVLAGFQRQHHLKELAAGGPPGIDDRLVIHVYPHAVIGLDTDLVIACLQPDAGRPAGREEVGRDARMRRAHAPVAAGPRLTANDRRVPGQFRVVVVLGHPAAGLRADGRAQARQPQGQQDARSCKLHAGFSHESGPGQGRAPLRANIRRMNQESQGSSARPARWFS